MAHITDTKNRSIQTEVESPVWRNFQKWIMNFTRHNTRITYLHRLYDFLDYLTPDIRPAVNETKLDTLRKKLAEIALDTITAEHILAYREKLVAQGKSPSSVNLALSAISSFFKNTLEANPCEGVKRLSVQKYGKSEPVDNVEQLLARVDTTTEAGKRDYFMLRLFLTTGIRRDVIRQLTPDSFKNGYMHFINKGGKQIKRKIGQKTLDALQDYLSLFPGKAGDSPLFVALGKERGKVGYIEKPLSTVAIWKIIQNRTGYKVHSLRHTAAQKAKENGATVYEVQALLGHKNTETTLLYLNALAQQTTGDNISLELDSIF